jgi:hypothetical protein
VFAPVQAIRTAAALPAPSCTPDTSCPAIRLGLVRADAWLSGTPLAATRASRSIPVCRLSNP